MLSHVVCGEGARQRPVTAAGQRYVAAVTHVKRVRPPTPVPTTPHTHTHCTTAFSAIEAAPYCRFAPASSPVQSGSLLSVTYAPNRPADGPNVSITCVSMLRASPPPPNRLAGACTRCRTALSPGSRTQALSRGRRAARHTSSHQVPSHGVPPRGGLSRCNRSQAPVLSGCTRSSGSGSFVHPKTAAQSV